LHRRSRPEDRLSIAFAVTVPGTARLSEAAPSALLHRGRSGRPGHRYARRPGCAAALAYAASVATVVVEVMLKPEIHDPQGEAIAGACHRLGFGQVTGVRQGKRFEVEFSGSADEAAVARIAAELLANPVIEQFSIHPV